MNEIRHGGQHARFGKFVWWIGVMATALLIATLVQGFSVTGQNSLRAHLFLALAATLMMLFSHLWIVIYLRFLRRQVRLHRESRGEGRQEEVPAAGLRWSAAAILLVFVSFFLGPLGLMGELPSSFHSAVGFAALAAQGLSLRREKRDLAASDRVLGRLFTAEG